MADESFRPFVETTWFHGERRRQLAIIMQPRGGRSPRMFTLVDIAGQSPEAR